MYITLSAGSQAEVLVWVARALIEHFVDKVSKRVKVRMSLR